jgi:hypothetical protein
MDVPRPLRAAMGRKRMVKSLKTEDRTIAVARRYAAIAEFQLAFTNARRTTEVDPLVTAAMEWRGWLKQAEERDAAGGPQYSSGDPDDAAQGEQDLLSSHLKEEAERIEREHGHDRAQAFYEMASGKATPLLHYVDDWLAEGGAKGPLKTRTQRQYRSDVDQLRVWLTTSRIPPTIEAVTKPVAGRYVTHLLNAGTDRRTANRKISAASAYWRWLSKRTATTANPWSGQSLSKVVAGGANGKRKRPFTDAELAALFNGGPDPELLDAMFVASLSGMRIEKCYRLTVADAADGWFNIRDAKTRAGIRRVPIHAALRSLVAHRHSGKAPNDFLFHEPGPLRDGYERSMWPSKRFSLYRKRLGVDEREEGRRQSSVDFHSLRRWFITKARGAGIDRAVVAAVVGHEVGNITDDVYSGGPSDAQLKACVAAVKLPAGVRLPVRRGGKRVASGRR